MDGADFEHVAGRQLLMSVDKLVDSTQLDADLTAVANAIRTKGGTSAALAFPAGFVQAITNIPSGGGSGVKHGTFTPASRTATVRIDTGDSSVSSITGLAVVPKSATPFLGAGKCLGSFFSFPGLFFKSIRILSGSGGTGATIAPGLSQTNSMISVSDGVITITSTNAYCFEPIEWEWTAW